LPGKVLKRRYASVICRCPVRPPRRTCQLRERTGQCNAADGNI
jgi:hypothetical protein